MAREEILLTQQKLDEIKAEFEILTTTKRKELADKLDWYRNNAEDEEDPSYYEVLEEKQVLEAKILELENIISRAKLLTAPQNGEVNMGNTVTVETKGKEVEFMIVDKIEADPQNGKFSDESPIGTKLLNKKPGESIEVDTPSGKMKYKVISIS